MNSSDPFAAAHALPPCRPLPRAQLAVVGERLQLKRLVPMAVDRAIVEIISPVVDRSVTIACMTTQVGGWGAGRSGGCELIMMHGRIGG